MEKIALENLGKRLNYDFVYHFCKEHLRCSLQEYTNAIEEKNVDIKEMKQEIEAIKEILTDENLFEVYVTKMQQEWIGYDLSTIFTNFGVSLEKNLKTEYLNHRENIDEALNRLGYEVDSSFFDNFSTLDDLRKWLCEKAGIEFIPVIEVKKVKNDPNRANNAYYEITNKAGIYENNGIFLPGIPYIPFTEYKNLMLLDATPKRIEQEEKNNSIKI